MRLGWSVIHWKAAGEKPVRLFCGDRLTAERIFNRSKATLKVGLLELRDSVMRVKDQAGDASVKPAKATDCFSHFITPEIKKKNGP